MQRLSILFLFYSSMLFSQSLHYQCIQDFDDCAIENLAVTIDRLKLTPSVIRYDATGTFLLEVYMSGPTTRLALNVGGVISDFNDSGRDGDKKSGDNIFTLRYPIQQVVTKLQVSDAFRPFLGFVEIYEGSTKTSQYNLFVPVRTAEMANVTVQRKEATVQATDVLVNIVAQNDKTVEYNTVAKKFYQHYDDRFDFINFVHIPGYIGNRFHSTVKTTVQGIGTSRFDNSSNFGSRGQLKGFNAFPLAGFYDPVTNGFVHEFGHQWINFADDSPFADGIPHWPFSSVGAGVMGISIGGRNGAGGSFSKTLTPATGGYNQSSIISTASPKFNEWELYYLGLIPKTEIKNPAIVFKDQSKYPTDGFYASSAFYLYSIDDFVSKYGNRAPNSSVSQKKFKVATLFITDSLMTADELAYYHFMTQRADSKVPIPAREGFSTYLGNSFFVATNGLASLDVTLASPLVSSQEIQANLKVIAYPNPFQSRLELELSALEVDEVQIQIWDMLGRKVWNGKQTLGTGANQVSIPTTNFSRGTYQVLILGEKHYGQVKVVK
ncbi:T9SS type A sorting domain-containing protein [Haliscomenobacter sp.]|uniref:T9SS type A sorting domain-containing protein n=1 Tax=Haliscomenobacter sp. TaxID=2717303 RepID=UPI003BAB60FB